MEFKFSRVYRVWHWMMAFSTLGLLATVVLRKTFLSWRTNSELIQAKMAEHNIEVSYEVAKITAKAIRNNMWEWHYIFAIFFSASLLMGIYFFMTKKLEFPLVTFFKVQKEEKLKYLVHSLLYVSLFIMAIGGGAIYFYEFLGLTKQSAGLIKDFHEYLMWGVAVLVSLHILGVIKHEIDTKESIVSKMIHGDK